MKRLLLTLMLIIPSSILLAANGIASYNRQDISIKIDKSTESITCIQDANEKKQWYYLSNKPKIVVNKEGTPIIKLVAYQKNTKAEIKNDGGILQCAINFSLPDKALSEVRKELAKISNISESKIKLAPLDVKNAKLMIYSPNGELLGDQVTTPEIGSCFANECIPIQMTLNNLSTSVVESLIKGDGGLYVYYLFDYDVLTPECSVKITANYDKAYNFFYNNSKASFPYKKWLILGNNAEIDFTKLIENLTKSEILKIKTFGNDSLTDEQLDILVAPVIEKLLIGLYDIKAPNKITNFKSNDIKEINKSWLNFSKNMILKNEETRKTGVFLYDFRKRQIETRKTAIGSILNLDDYSENQRKSFIQITDPTFWKSAFYSLPRISKCLNCVDEITLNVIFLYKGKQAEGTEKQLAKWTNKNGWLNAKNEECIGFEFPLQYLYDKYAKNNKSFYKNLIFQQNFEITYMEGNATKIKKFTSNVPAFNKNVPISTPMVGVTYIEFEANNDLISWDKNNYESGEFKGLKSNLTKIGIKVEAKNTNNKANTILTSKNPTVGLWVDNIYNKSTGLYSVPEISATYTFYNSKLANAMNTSDKKTIVIEKEDALSHGTVITFINDAYMPVEKPESYK